MTSGKFPPGCIGALVVAVIFLLIAWPRHKVVPPLPPATTLVIVLDETHSFVNDCGECQSPSAVSAAEWPYDYWSTSVLMAAEATKLLKDRDRVVIFGLDDDVTGADDLRFEWEVPVLDLLNPDSSPEDMKDTYDADRAKAVEQILSLQVRASSSAFALWNQRNSESESSSSKRGKPGAENAGAASRKGTDMNGLLRRIALKCESDISDGRPICILLFSDLNAEELPEGVNSAAQPPPDCIFSKGDCRIAGLNLPPFQLERELSGKPVVAQNRFGDWVPVKRTIEDPYDKREFWANWFTPWGLKTDSRAFRTSEEVGPTFGEIPSSSWIRRPDGLEVWLHPVPTDINQD